MYKYLLPDVLSLVSSVTLLVGVNARAKLIKVFPTIPAFLVLAHFHSLDAMMLAREVNTTHLAVPSHHGNASVDFLFSHLGSTTT